MKWFHRCHLRPVLFALTGSTQYGEAESQVSVRASLL